MLANQVTRGLRESFWHAWLFEHASTSNFARPFFVSPSAVTAHADDRDSASRHIASYLANQFEAVDAGQGEVGNDERGNTVRDER